MEQLSNSQRSFSPPPSPSGPELSETPAPQRREPGFIGEVIRFSLIALLVVLPIRLFIAQPFIVSGASMEATFSTGEYLIVDQLTYHFEDPERGDVIVFRYPRDPSKFFIKRVIGIPGDTVSIDGDRVTISNNEHRDGVVLEESYVLAMNSDTTLTESLGGEEYFVMGDNRDASSDSRMWGVLQRDKIIGRAFFRLFPLTEISILPGDVNIDQKLMSSEE